VVVAAALYLAALVTYPRINLLKGFDLGVYRMGGLLARHHASRLYSWQLRPGIQFTYTPFAALVFVPASFASLRALMDVAVVVSTIALVATISIAFRELGLRRNTRLGATLLVAGITFWSEPVQRTLFLGQVELVLMALVVWDLCQPDDRRWKGAATGIAAGIKLVPLIFIAYLLITRRLRQAAVAAATFIATVAVGFAALPSASARWWFHGYFLNAGRTGFVGDLLNQSLRGTATRFAGSAAAGQQLWLGVAGLSGVVGLGAATWLYRAGRRFESLIACALTGLLISPISWDSHWVWIAPGLAVLVAGAVAAGRGITRVARVGTAALLALAFFAWPRLWAKGAGLLHGGLLFYAPQTRFGHGDSPALVEYHWHGLQLLAGNVYVLVGSGLFILVLYRTVRVLPAVRVVAPAAR
jgi:alpha-1,2-mannosyltransferase